MSTLLTTEANDQSSRHCSDMSTGVMSDQTGQRDVSREGGEGVEVHQRMRANPDGLRCYLTSCM